MRGNRTESKKRVRSVDGGNRGGGDGNRDGESGREGSRDRDSGGDGGRRRRRGTSKERRREVVEEGGNGRVDRRIRGQRNRGGSSHIRVLIETFGVTGLFGGLDMSWAVARRELGGGVRPSGGGTEARDRIADSIWKTAVVLEVAPGEEMAWERTSRTLDH